MKLRVLVCCALVCASVCATGEPQGPDRVRPAAGDPPPLPEPGSTESTETHLSPSAKLKRDSGRYTDDDSISVQADASHFESRQGRLAQSGLVQAQRSNVATFSGGGAGSARAAPQGPPRSGSSPRPPSPPPSADAGPLPPAPPFDIAEIRCMKMASRERFSAVISTPDGFAGAPVFEDRPSIDPITSRVCQIQPGKRSGTYQLEVTNLDACGVKSCTFDGQPGLCLTLRFPFLPGLKLPEDEIVEVQCKPQDRTVAERKDLDFDGDFTPRVEQKSPLTFSGGKQEFVCEIGLFRRLPGTALFSQRIGPGTAVELGEEVQLRSIVRGNDGWHHSKLTDVVVRRLKRSSASVGDGSANLVLSDGCRNPAYKPIAGQHPQRDPRSTLLNNFNFRVFLFQDMEDGDSIVVSARVIACVEAIDCAPTLCNDDRGQGFGRRKRSANESQLDGAGDVREVSIEQLIYPNGTVTSGPARHLKGWESDLALRVSVPGEYYAGTRSAVSMSALENHCFLYLMLTVGLGTALGVTALLVGVYCACTCRRSGKSDAAHLPPTPAPPATVTASSATLETLMEVCYPELQMIDALSRSVRQKKQHVHDEMLKLYGANNAQSTDGNLYTTEPRPSVRNVKRQNHLAKERNGSSSGNNVTTVVVGPARKPVSAESLYWEIDREILPPTPV